MGLGPPALGPLLGESRSPPRDSLRRSRGRPPRPLPFSSALSTLSSSSRRPCRSIESVPPPPPPLPPLRRCGIAEAAPACPPPPWCPARQRLAAARAISARADWRCRRARRCHDCSPRDVATSAAATRKPRAAEGRPTTAVRATKAAEAATESRPRRGGRASRGAARGRRRRGDASAAAGAERVGAPSARARPAQVAGTASPS